MRLSKSIGRIAPLVLAVFGATSLSASAIHEPQVKSLMSKALIDFPQKEVLMLEVEYPPGGADPVHRHNAHGFIYVIEGSIVMGVAGGQEVTLRAGETFYEGPTDVHTVGRNASKTLRARFVVFLLKSEGTPAVLPAN